MASDSHLRDVAASLGEQLDVVEANATFGARTTYRVGGPAGLFVSAESSEDLAAVASAVAEASLSVTVLGNGSNLLVADAGFDGLVLALAPRFADVQRQPGGTVRIGGAASLPIVARQLTSMGLAGFEWAVGVPGTLGGAVRMNAGGHGSDMAAVVVHADIVDLTTGELRRYGASELAFDYRSSRVAPHQVVVAAEILLEDGDPAVGKALLSEIVAWRRQNQPGGQNAGSVFTNPPGDSAGRIIDAVGLKGLRVGTAQVSTKHANFIQADPDGSADDIAALMAEIVERVQDQTGIRLHAETRMIGFGERFCEPNESSMEDL